MSSPDNKHASLAIHCHARFTLHQANTWGICIAWTASTAGFNAPRRWKVGKRVPPGPTWEAPPKPGSNTSNGNRGIQEAELTKNNLVPWSTKQQVVHPTTRNARKSGRDTSLPDSLNTRATDASGNATAFKAQIKVISRT